MKRVSALAALCITLNVHAARAPRAQGQATPAAELCGTLFGVDPRASMRAELLGDHARLNEILKGLNPHALRAPSFESMLQLQRTIERIEETIAAIEDGLEMIDRVSVPELARLRANPDLIAEFSQSLRERNAAVRAFPRGSRSLEVERLFGDWTVDAPPRPSYPDYASADAILTEYGYPGRVSR